jgi:hypothetical protein
MTRVGKFIAVLGLVTLAQCAFAAPQVINFAGVTGSSVTFSDTGSGVNFTFPPSSSSSDIDFGITSTSGFTGLDVLSGLKGVILGTYNYLTSSITTNGGVQTASVTGSGSFIIHDGSGHDFTSTLTWVDIQTSGTGGTIDASGTVNLSNFAYSGTNTQLQQLAANPGGIVVTTFQFVSPTQTLTSLANSCPSTAPCSTSLSGSLTAVPEPGFYGTLALGLSGLAFSIQARRRRKSA